MSSLRGRVSYSGQVLGLVAGCVSESTSEYQCLLHREWHVAVIGRLVKRSDGMEAHDFLTERV